VASFFALQHSTICTGSENTICLNISYDIHEVTDALLTFTDYLIFIARLPHFVARLPHFVEQDDLLMFTGSIRRIFVRVAEKVQFGCLRSHFHLHVR